MDFLNAAVDSINTLLWSYVLIVVLVGCGLYFTLSTGLVQLRMLPEMFRLLTEGIGKKTEGKAISSFQAFCVSTASRVGVGNIAGVAIAIVTGGPGAPRRPCLLHPERSGAAWHRQTLCCAHFRDLRLHLCFRAGQYHCPVCRDGFQHSH